MLVEADAVADRATLKDHRDCWWCESRDEGLIPMQSRGTTWWVELEARVSGERPRIRISWRWRRRSWANHELWEEARRDLLARGLALPSHHAFQRGVVLSLKTVHGLLWFSPLPSWFARSTTIYVWTTASPCVSREETTLNMYSYTCRDENWEPASSIW